MLDRGLTPNGGARDDCFKSYPVRRFCDLEPHLKNNDLVKGVIGRESIVVMYGAAGSSKSFCAIEFGLAIASGQPWRGCRTQRGRVIYVAAEGARGMENRLCGARERLALGPPDQVDFLLVPSTVRLIEGTTDVEGFVRTIREQGSEGAALVIIDTLSQSMPGADENGPKDMTAAIAAAQRIRDELGATVLLVHHAGKDEARGARGHSSLRAATDTELEVKRESEAQYRIRVSKQKEGETGAVWMHRVEQVELGEDDDGDPVTTAVVKPLPVSEAASVVATKARGTGKSAKLTADVVEAMMRLRERGEGEPVPRKVLEESGHLAHIGTGDHKSDGAVLGFRRSRVRALLIERYEGSDAGGRDSDESADTPSKELARRRDAARQSASRRIERGIEGGVIVAHGGWLWMRESG